MSENEAFLRAIVARPDEDLPRLVYADFVQEAGEDDRAELIRAQCALARLPTSDAERPALARREAELLLLHKSEWRIAGLTGPQTFRRGFVEVVETTADSLLKIDPEVLALFPVRHLRLVNANRPTADLARLPIWGRLHTLTLNNNTFGAGGRLRLLDLAEMPELRSLSLRNNRLWPEAVAELAETRAAPRLTRLDLSGNPIGDEGLETLARHPAFAALQELIVRSDELPDSECVHAAGAAAVANSWTLSSLTVLNFADHYLSDAGLIGLAGSSNVDRLVELDLSYNGVGNSGEGAVEALVASRHLRNLRRLNLAGSVLPPDACEALANWPQLARMEWIDLRECAIAAPDELRDSPHAARLLLDPPEVEWHR